MIDGREVRSSEDLIRKLTLAIDQISTSVIITALDGTIEYVNRHFSEVTGLSREEALGKTPQLWQSGETPDAVYRDLWKKILSGMAWRGELHNRRKNGDLYWDAVTITPIRDPAGLITHFLATQDDVTERRRAQQALEESEKRFRTIIEASFDGIYIADAGVLLEVNRGLVDMFGYENEGEVIGRPLTDFVAKESMELVHDRIATIMEGTYEVVGLRKDGQRISLEITARNHVMDGRAVRMCAVRDITQKRSLEAQFRQSQKMEAVGRLAGGVAHDFNNLLTVITSYTDLLLSDLGASDPRREDLDQIRQAAIAAASLTRQLLAFSRQQVIVPQQIVLEDVVGHIHKMLKRLIGEDISLVTRLSAAPTTVKIDPGQIEQVIMNLAVNARDAMPTGGQLTIETSIVTLDEDYVRTHPPVSPGRYAMLAVSDTGTGMDANTRARIFEPFFTTKETGKGTGLGLATVYGIVKQSGGFIWVYSEPGQGATFKIYLPKVADATDSLEPERAALVLPRGTETILLVEDAPAVRTVARQILEHHGYTVIEAPAGEPALNLAAKMTSPIDLLLTDVVMPGMSGRELGERFAALHPSTRILYMSGYTDDAIVRHGILQSEIAYLQKPFTPVALARKVREVLDSKRPGAEFLHPGPR